MQFIETRGWGFFILCGMWWLNCQAELCERQRSRERKWRKERMDGNRRTSERGSEVKGGWRWMERCKKKQRGKRGQGAGITNESSLLFSQLFLLVPWTMLYTRPCSGYTNGPSLLSYSFKNMHSVVVHEHHLCVWLEVLLSPWWHCE